MIFEVIHEGETFTCEAVDIKDCRKFLAFYYGLPELPGSTIVRPAKEKAQALHDDAKETLCPVGTREPLSPVVDWDALAKLYKESPLAAIKVVKEVYGIDTLAASAKIATNLTGF